MFDLETAIDQAYSAYLEELRLKEEEQQRQEQAEIDQAVADFQAELDKTLSREMQQALNLKITRGHTPSAKINYRNHTFGLSYDYEQSKPWVLVEKANNSYLFPEDVSHVILIKLGKAKQREAKIPIPF